MKILDIQIVDNNLLISGNGFVLIGLICFVVIIAIILNYYCNPNNKLKRFKITELKLEVGKLSATIKRDYSNMEIAYKIWVEMITRKVALIFDEENDVIVEVYNSWYDCFKNIRENIKSITGPNIECSKDLIDFLVKILNGSLREHLTKWQAKFRKWYDEERTNCSNEMSPQAIQKQYPEYKELIVDLKQTNKELIELEKQLHVFLFESGMISKDS